MHRTDASVEKLTAEGNGPLYERAQWRVIGFGSRVMREGSQKANTVCREHCMIETSGELLSHS